MGLLAQSDPEWWERLITTVGVPGTFLILLGLAVWKCAPKVASAFVAYLETGTATQESNAEALKTLCQAHEHLTVTSVKSGESHAKTHRAGIVAADALQAFADTHSGQAGAAVKPHVEKIKEILER